MAVEFDVRKWTVILLLLHGTQSAVAFTVNDEISLKALLLNNSGIATVRPTQVTLIELSFNLLAINNVDIKTELFGVSGWWSIKWTDSRLSWTSSGFTGIPVVQVSNTDIWTPALVVDNSITDLSAIDESTIPIRLRQDGQVTWNPPGILETACEMTVTYFPFDIQTCAIQVTSFGYTIQELNVSVQASGISRRYFQENGEWTVLKTWNERSEYTEDGYTYAKVTFYIKLQRRAVYYGLNTMLPVLLNSLLIPMVFLLPHDSGEKIGYCLTVLLAYVVILTIVTAGLPTTAKSQSLLGVYIAMVLTLSGMSVVFAIHSLNIFHRSPNRPIPAWQVKLCRVGYPIMRLKCAKEKTSRSVTPVNDDYQQKKDRLNRLNDKAAATSDKTDLGHVSASGVQADVRSVESDGDDYEEMSWQFVARVYDAFFLRFYFAIIICSSVVFTVVIASNQF